MNTKLRSWLGPVPQNIATAVAYLPNQPTVDRTEGQFVWFSDMSFVQLPYCLTPSREGVTGLLLVLDGTMKRISLPEGCTPKRVKIAANVLLIAGWKLRGSPDYDKPKLLSI